MRTRKSGRLILNTRELTEQIHLPTLSFSASSHFFPLPSSPSLSHLSPLSLLPLPQLAPNPLTSHLSHHLSPLSPKKLDLNEQMKRGGERAPSGGFGKGWISTFWMGLFTRHVTLSDSPFALFSIKRQNCFGVLFGEEAGREFPLSLL